MTEQKRARMAEGFERNRIECLISSAGNSVTLALFDCSKERLIRLSEQLVCMFENKLRHPTISQSVAGQVGICARRSAINDLQ